MHEEIEIKVMVENPEDVLEFLEKNGKYIETKNQTDNYYIIPSKDFFAESPVKEYLRIREEALNDQVAYHFCHYDKDGKLEKTDEYETKIDDPKVLQLIFSKASLIKKITVSKKRTHFEYKGFRVLVDYIDGLGSFIEVETECVDRDYKKAKNNCLEVLKDLEANWKEASNMGYPDMLLSKIK